MGDKSRRGRAVRGPGVPIGDGGAASGFGPRSDSVPASEALWSAALATGDVFYVLRVEPDLAFEFVSDSVADLVGYTPQEHYDDPSLAQRLVDPRDEARLAAALATPVGENVEAQVRWVHRDGHTVWTQHRARKRVRDDGSVVLEGSGRDITDLRRAQEALAATSVQLRTLTENITDLVAQTRLDRTIEYVSPSVTTSLGWVPEEVLGRPYDEFWHPDDLAVMTAAQKESASGEAVRVRARARCKDGSSRWMEVVGHAVFDPDGRPVRWITVARDVEDQIRAEQALTAAAQEFQVIADNIADVIIRTRPDLTIDYVSPSMTAIGGWEPEELVGANNLDLFHPDDLAAMTASRDAALAGNAIRFRARARCKDGSYRWVEVAGNLVSAEDGSPLYGVTVARDIDDQVRSQQALADSEERFRLLAENASDVVVRIGPDGSVLWVSPSVETTLGWTPQGFGARSIRDLMHPDDLPRILAQQREILARGGSEGRGQARYATADGGWRWMSIVGRVVRDEQGRILGAVDSLRDIQAEVEARQALARSEERFRLLAENASDVVYLVRVDGVLEWVSPSIRESLGWDADDLVGTRPWHVVHPDDRDAAAANLAEVARSSQTPKSFTMRLRQRDGSYQWMSASGHAVQSEGAVVGFVVGLRDVTAEVEAREALTRSERRLRAAMESAPVGMAVVSLDGHFLDANPALCRMVGRDRQWLLEHATADIIHPDDLPVDHQTHRHVESGAADSARQTIRLLTADGRVLWVDHAVGLLRDDDGTAQSFVVHFVDMTQEHRAQEHLRFQATHDELTSLVNRRELTSRMDLLLSHPPRHGTRLGVLFIDVDRLKTVNDTLGHAVGDHLLVQTANRISAQVRAEDVVARVGGDEFVVLLLGIQGQADAERIAAEVRSAATQPLTYNDTDLHPTVSIGVTLAQPGQDVDDVLRDADTAAYAAKAAGRDRVIVHSPGLSDDNRS